jgi:AcrR family transcriptional regulator
MSMLNEVSQAESLFERTASPREKKRVQRIEDIIDTAARIFVRDGYAQFSARRVASEMGISLSNLQHYCGTTENLLLSMIRAKIEVFVTQFVAIANDASLSPEQRLIKVIEQDMEAARDPWIASFAFQSWALGEHDQAVGRHLAAIYETFCQVLTSVIREVNPKVTEARAKMFAVLIGSQIEGLLFYQKQAASLGPDWSDAIATARAMWLMMIRAE